MADQTCRYCGAEISWIKCKNNHLVPVDPEPVWIRWDAAGKTYLMANGNYIQGFPAGDADESPGLREAWVKHAAVCTGRKRKKRRI